MVSSFAIFTDTTIGLTDRPTLGCCLRSAEQQTHFHGACHASTLSCRSPVRRQRLPLTLYRRDSRRVSRTGGFGAHAGGRMAAVPRRGRTGEVRAIRRCDGAVHRGAGLCPARTGLAGSRSGIARMSRPLLPTNCRQQLHPTDHVLASCWLLPIGDTKLLERPPAVLMVEAIRSGGPGVG